MRRKSRAKDKRRVGKEAVGRDWKVRGKLQNKQTSKSKRNRFFIQVHLFVLRTGVTGRCVVCVSLVSSAFCS